MTVKTAQPAIVQYVDHCQHSDVSTHDFFTTLGLCLLEVQGFAMETECDGFEVVKVLQIDDLDGGSNSQGIVIPKACVLRITYLASEESPLEDTKKALA